MSNLRFIICQVVAYGRLKMKENFELLALKQEIITLIISYSKSRGSLREVVAYKKFQTGKRLTFWKTGRWQAPVVIFLII